MTHTPRPWYDANTGNNQGLVISEVNGTNVAIIYDKRDAKLIAAAPDLLEIAKFAESYTFEDCSPRAVELRRMIYAVYAKLEGE